MAETSSKENNQDNTVNENTKNDGTVTNEIKSQNEIRDVISKEENTKVAENQYTLASPARSSSLNPSARNASSSSPQPPETSTHAISIPPEPAVADNKNNSTSTSPISTTSQPASPSTSKKFFKKVGNKIDKIIKIKTSDSILQSQSEPEIGSSLEAITVTDSPVVQTKSIFSNTESSVHNEEAKDDTNDSKDVKEISVEENEAEPKRNKFGIRFRNVSQFIVRSSSVVLEKLKEEFDELDRQLLGKSEDTPPTNDRAVNGGTKNAFSEIGDALNERGEKLNELNNKVNDLSTSSETFAALAKKIAEKEANRKWYQW
ncbi:8379_t:CDS:2 [Diversispora eburnea]|uniref:8379_t:CDS:1 n=1 Tax=Diversispora eburnea TaxID=1213867 RepID=A0A9N9FZA8_9GLOM|nr:8379_t:CDS:2 [Diversispora eburnea]